MTKEAIFTMKLEPDLRDSFMAEAASSHRPASQIVRELMRDFVDRQRKGREYDSFLHEKVSLARDSIKAGHGRSNEDVEATFASLRGNVGPRSEV
jgi:predicted transcriptional regulator